jgi:hypothetical protein
MRPYAWLSLAASALAITLTAAAPAPSAASAGHLAPRLATNFQGALYGVAATSASNMWAVGNFNNNTLMVHWNGHKWAKVAAPNPAPGNDGLNAISMFSARYGWAVGILGVDSLAMRWNGRVWKTVPTPKLNGGSLLAGVVTVTTTSAWAVGGTGWPTLPLIEHWNGKAWKQVTSPYHGSANLYGVAASSASNVWAVGSYSGGVLTLHWNGRSWRQVAAPSPVDSDLLGVTTTSATNAWAVGDYTNGTDTNYTLIEHWNGKSWKRVPGPSPRQGAVLLAVAAKSPSLAFAVGQTTPLTLPNENKVGTTFLERWDGHTWREVTKPAPKDGQLAAVAFGSSKCAWTVGSNLGGPALIRRWNGTAWSEPVG